MLDLFYNDGAIWFTAAAIIGTAFFAFRLILLTLGLGHDVHGDFSLSDAHHGDPGDAFKALSLQGILAFAMGFGWVGLGALKGTGWSWPTSLGVAVAGGVAMVWLLGVLLKGIYDLQSSGNIPLEAALDHSGTVYANVPARGQGRGQVKLTVNQHQRIYNAVSDDAPIETNTAVRVVKVNEDRTLTVSRVN